MSKEFVITGGKVVCGNTLKVLDKSNNVKEIIECQDNIDFLEEKIEKIESDKEIYEYNNKHKIKSNFFSILVGIISTIVFIFGTHDVFSIQLPFGNWDANVAAAIVKLSFQSFLIIMEALAVFFPVSYIRNDKRMLNALNMQAEYLKDEIKKQKQKINHLNNTKKYSLEKKSKYNNNVIKLDNKYKDTINDMSKLLFDVSMENVEYSELLETGELKEMIQDIYKDYDNSEEIVDKQLEYTKRLLLKKSNK